MQMDRLYPPGNVWWVINDDYDTPPRHQVPSPSANSDIPDKIRLYEVLDVEKVFGQIIFSRDMLRYVLACGSQDQTNSTPSSHMPHTYDRVLQQLYPNSQVVP